MKKLEQLEKEILEVSEKQKSLLKELEELKANKEEEWKAGDYAFCIQGDGSGFTKGKIYIVGEPSNRWKQLGVKLDDLGSSTNGHNHERFRKATVEEIYESLKTDIKNV